MTSRRRSLAFEAPEKLEQLVKDLRTGRESSDPVAVLAGGEALDGFLDAFLRHRASARGSGDAG